MMLPSVFTASKVTLNHSESVQRSVSRGGNIQLGRRTAFATEVTIESPKIHHTKVGDLAAFLLQTGLNNPFDVVLPLLSDTKGAATANLRVNGAKTAGMTAIALDNAPNNTSGILKPYDMLNFSGHDKAYFVGLHMTGDVINSINSNSSGQFDITLAQPLIKNIANNEVVNITAPTITVVRTSDIEYVLDVNKFVTMSFDALEFI